MAIPAYEGSFFLVFLRHFELPVATAEVQAAKHASVRQLVH